ncbi:universal stress protein [Methyloceanibacter sp.]|uniref:universal stress protein n=1 Tax=Methyloceanibacter sp. TaxID=1965321 RepID=UPI003D6D11DB
MSSKLSKILLPVSQQGTTEACRRAAFGLARDFAARLEVVHLCPAAWQRLPYATEISPFFSEEVLDICRGQVSADQAEAKAWFEQAVLAHPGAPTDFQCVEGFPATTMTARARVADLSVVPSIAARDDEFWMAVGDAALFQSGRPVLVVPQETPNRFGETIVVAWKDSVESVRAVTAAEPFLAKAKRIVLLSVAEDDKDDPSLAAMAEYLALTGLNVETSRIASKFDTVGKALLHGASNAPGTLLVMGAYGHWRWREWVFGGVTQEVLRDATVPALMAH